ncbi:MAG: GNAT family N-acetyltransferase [Myxococcota bacterium]|nr:GNAT family N-acetyltransferase [Myxococcota bacterium]
MEESPDALERHVAAWDVLATRAAEANPFYESFALLPAWRHLAPKGLRVVCVWAPNALPGQPPHLAGLFPIVRHDRYKGAPVVTYSTWRHRYTYLTTPLVRDDLASLALETFLMWLYDGDSALFTWDGISSDGAFRHALIDTLNHFRITAFHETTHTRAYFQPAASADHYLEHAMAGKKRKELRRQERRLCETGKLVYDQLAPDGDLEAWLDEFLALEALGWKGREGSALRNDASTVAIFRSYARGAFERKRWMTLALRLDGRPIAMKCNLLAGDGAVAFKIAYDESYARSSPGVLLEVEHIRRLHEAGAPAWMDSGAATDHPMIGHLWRDKIAIETLVVPTSSRIGELTVAALPLIRWTSRAVKSAWLRLRKRT